MIELIKKIMDVAVAKFKELRNYHYFNVEKCFIYQKYLTNILSLLFLFMYIFDICVLLYTHIIIIYIIGILILFIRISCLVNYLINVENMYIND